eukprot:SAG31_NODE_27667_length_422_cov_0.897833_1_plen_140_part_11
MGVYYDRGAAIVGGWLQGAWAVHDSVRDIDLLWGGEMGQEGAVLFAVDVTGCKGQVVQQHKVGCREFMATVDHSTGTLWILNTHGLRQPGLMLQSWTADTNRLTPHGFPPFVRTEVRGDDRRQRRRCVVRNSSKTPPYVV